jgi:hypothetical protein
MMRCMISVGSEGRGVGAEEGADCREVICRGADEAATTWSLGRAVESGDDGRGLGKWRQLSRRG